MTLRDVRRFGVLVAALAVAAGANVAFAGAAVPGASAFDAPSSTDAAQRTVDSCTTIDEPGTYVLSKKIENGGKTAISKACIEITADGVTFDGNGHLIDGRGVSHTKGIAVVDAKDVTIRNVAVDDWHSGILVTGGSATVRNVKSYSNAYGVRVEDADGATIENSTITDNLVGVSTTGADVNLSGNDISDNDIRIQREN
ncbi:right-handed parallel beta-helix repeat-containing protein (plasmid) [Halorussus limi]|uniref:Right-handed parallel beta-helix repeat-containing protein n=1 Tax=Halorussus limi TaxID=2938695 RepID=A0A8U0I179_9EURY|nr:right-handed parallel beta-helix repeat-containing protein [Halorussus limi]UPV76514.1 right-handed parallel beta-helix repeat-containing protein [Halorussus limi]